MASFPTCFPKVGTPAKEHNPLGGTLTTARRARARAGAGGLRILRCRRAHWLHRASARDAVHDAPRRVSGVLARAPLAAPAARSLERKA